MSTLQTYNLKHPDAAGNNITFDSSGHATFSNTVKTSKIENASTTNGGVEIDSSGHVQVDGLQLPSQGPLGRRNLVGNGAMRVAQRGQTEEGGQGTIGYYTVDRWRFADSQNPGGVFTESQSTDAPEGFNFSRKYEVTTADAVVDADEQQYTDQFIEGQDLQHLDYGTANAKPITLSFWVKSSVAQTFGLNLTHEDGGGAYGVSYTVNAADTWEYKTVTFNGNTATALPATNARGLRVRFALTAGSDFINGTDATGWGTDLYGQHDNTWVQTVGNTWQITGVQLEVGEVATPFEHKSYCEDLAECKRYFQTFDCGTYGAMGLVGRKSGSGYVEFDQIIPHVEMRASPTGSWLGTLNGFTLFAVSDATATVPTEVAIAGVSSSAFTFRATTSTGGTGTMFVQGATGTANQQEFTLSAEL